MSFKLEDLPYQRQAIDAVVRLFEGQQRDYFDLDLSGDCFPNRLLLSRKEIISNVEKIIDENEAENLSKFLQQLIGKKGELEARMPGGGSVKINAEGTKGK